MQRHNIKKSKAHTKSTRIGRGGLRGKTSGRGHKGQKARAGHKIRPEERDMIKKLPKRRGHGKNRARTVNPHRVRPVSLPISRIARVVTEPTTITPQTLAARGLIRGTGGKIPQIKLIGNTPLSVKLTVSDCLATPAAQKAIESAGGSVTSK